MTYQVGKKQCSNSGRKRNDIDPLESDFMVQPPSLLEFPGPLTPPPPWNFQFPPWWGSGYFLEPHIQRIKSQKWLTLTDSPAYHCVVQSFSYWIVLKVLAVIQFRSRGEWRNLPYFAISQVFRHREVQKDCQNRKREIGYMPLENCPFLKTAYFQSLFSMWLWF